jgi:peptidyl-prolyl cis-trans isomerase B (cyclophilin B)
VSAADQDVVNAIRGGDTMDKVTVEGDTSQLFAHAEVAERLPLWNKVLDDNA